MLILIIKQYLLAVSIHSDSYMLIDGLFLCFIVTFLDNKHLWGFLERALNGVYFPICNPLLISLLVSSCSRYKALIIKYAAIRDTSFMRRT